MSLILHNANIITMDYYQPLTDAVVIEDGRIVGIGYDTDVCHGLTAHTRVIDCRGGTLLPGFIDAHCHFLSYAASLMSVNLANLSSVSDIQQALRLRAAHTPPGRWLRAVGLDETALAEKRAPTRWEIDAAVPDRPVRLIHRSGHASVLNSLALKEAGITTETEEPAGGFIDRDVSSGEPSGLVVEMNDRIDAAPPLDYDELARAVRAAAECFLGQGVTSIQDATATNGPAEWELFGRLIAEGHLPLGVTLMEGASSFGLLPESALGGRLRRGPVKIALMQLGPVVEPSQDEIDEMVWRAHCVGRQVAIHAVGRESIEAAVTAIERALEREPCVDHRHRIEHCGICPPELAERIGAAGIIVVTQPSFLYYNGDRYDCQMPLDDLPDLYPLRRLYDCGVSLAAGSDAPVVPPSPLRSIQAAALRRSRSGVELTPHQRVSTKEALRMHLLNAAWSAFEEPRRGSITRRKEGDVILVSGNPLSTTGDEIADLTIELVVVGGRVLKQSPSLDPTVLDTDLVT